MWNGTNYLMDQVDQMDKTDYPADFKYQALLCLTYFRHAVTELCRTLCETGDAAAKLHGKYESYPSPLLRALADPHHHTTYSPHVPYINNEMCKNYLAKCRCFCYHQIIKYGFKAGGNTIITEISLYLCHIILLDIILTDHLIIVPPL